MPVLHADNIVLELSLRLLDVIYTEGYIFTF